MKTKKCHTKNIYDNSRLHDGDRVMSSLSQKTGVVTVKTCEVTNWITFDYLEVAWGDGSIGHPYANQLVLLGNPNL